MFPCDKGVECYCEDRTTGNKFVPIDGVEELVMRIFRLHISESKSLREGGILSQVNQPKIS